MIRDKATCDAVLQKMIDVINAQIAGDDGDLDGMRDFILRDFDDRQLVLVGDFISSFKWRRQA